jgi:CarD family transcriptional regulator
MGENRKMYYTLVPLYASGSKFFVPTDSKKIVTRSVMTKQEVEQLIAEWNEIETLWVDNDKNREEIYKEALRSCDFRQWAKLMKTSYQRNQARLKRGKKVTASDERYLHMAEENLFGELAIPLCMTKSEAEEYFLDKIRTEG